MATLRTRIYESRNTYHDIFKMIRMDVERVSTLIFPLFGNLTSDTDKFWVGKINSSEGTFKIVRTNSSILPLRIFKGNFFSILIQGQVYSHENNARIEVKFRLFWSSKLFLLSILLFAFLFLISYIIKNDWISIIKLLPILFVFDILPLSLLKLQLDKSEIQILKLLGVQ